LNGLLMLLFSVSSQDLRTGFILRCFQDLSIRNITTLLGSGFLVPANPSAVPPLKSLRTISRLRHLVSY